MSRKGKGTEKMSKNFLRQRYSKNCGSVSACYGYASVMQFAYFFTMARPMPFPSEEWDSSA